MSSRPRIIQVYCQGKSRKSHADKRLVVATFVRENGEWLDLMAHGRFIDLGNGTFENITPPGRELEAEPHTATILDSNNQRVSYQHPRQKLQPGQYRHHRLRCKACGLGLPVRGQTLGSALDRVAEAGESTISLRELITRIC